MHQQSNLLPAFVIKAEELFVLNYLAPNHPRPRQVEWINRGTDQRLRRTSVDMLMRTYFQDMASPSVVRLHHSAGLRALFRSDNERQQFASAFTAARQREAVARTHLVCALFSDRKSAEEAVVELKNVGIPVKAISLLCQASQFLDTDVEWSDGHSKQSVAGAVAGGGIAGAVLGAAAMTIPIGGPIITAGTLAATMFTSMTAFGGIIGATGGAIAKMLTDHDVDGIAAAAYEKNVKRSKVFVAVDTQIAQGNGWAARNILRRHGGQTQGASVQPMDNATALQTRVSR